MISTKKMGRLMLQGMVAQFWEEIVEYWVLPDEGQDVV